MSQLDDLKAAIADLATEAITDLEAVLAKIASTPPDDSAALAALVQQARDATAKLRNDMATAGIVVTAPPPATPPSG